MLDDPKKMSLMEGLCMTCPSHNCEKQLYIAYANREYPILKKLHGIIPRIPDGRVEREEIWVSNIDGSGMRLIGTLPINSNPEALNHLAYDPVWSPDDSHISFVSGGGIYSFPVGK